MMKRMGILMICVCLCLSIAGCGKDMAAEGTDANISVVGNGIDVDLTQLSSTMVYAEVYNMLTSPEDYVGKIVKMKGAFALYQAVDGNNQPISDMIYFACVIADATACCSQGIEFVLAGEHTYPEDYPEPGTEITVAGRFQIYEENGHTYVHLVDAVLE